MRLTFKDGLPFLTVQVGYASKTLDVPSVLLDTGSASTIFSADRLSSIGLMPSPSDRLFMIRGVGGSEVVFSKQVDFLQGAEHKLEGVEIEVGGMDYGFEINGILGMNFLTAAGAIIDLHHLEIRFEE